MRFGIDIDLAVSKRVLSGLAKLDKAQRPRGVSELLPGYASLMIHYDPLKVKCSQVESWCRQTMDGEDSEEEEEEPRQISIPVNYGGEHGPDMDEVARLTGLSTSEVARMHSDGKYRVYFLGFLGGFPYLGGLKAPLTSVPRLVTPRQKLPKGTVGIAGGQTGVYTVSSPGGWHCLGRTPMRLFDPSQDPPAVLRAGDLVKFVPTSDAIQEEDDIVESAQELQTPWVEIVTPGPMTTVQDLGRYGYFRHGVSRAGAADDLSLRMGNTLVGNDESAAGLEVMMGGLKMRCLAPCAIALCGADCAAKLKRKGLPKKMDVRVNEVTLLQAEDELELGFAKDGMRTYICVAGGVDVPVVLGSRCTDARGALGGFNGRILRKGDRLGRFHADVPALVCSVKDPLRSGASSAAGRNWKLRVASGPGDPKSLPQDGDLAAKPIQSLLQRKFNVLPRSDRMAVILTLADCGEKLVGGQQMSEACVSGTIQLPPDGNPVIMLAEHQTTGGYKVAGVVIRADLWQVGQMRPGDNVTFQHCSQEDAVTALQELRASIQETQPKPAFSRSLQFKLAPRSQDGLKTIDLNADAGEGYDDAGLLRYVTSVNIACGGHVGSPEMTAKTVALAVEAGACIGAHPSFVDREGFGRRALDTPPAELRDQVLWQVRSLDGLCRAFGTRVQYIKPHGALYHTVLSGGDQGQAVVEAAEILQLPLLLMPKSPWASYGEGFAERAYDGDSLRPRDKPGAVIHDPSEAAQQALALARRPNLHSICVHGDSPNAVSVAQAVRAVLDTEFKVAPCVVRAATSAPATENVSIGQSAALQLLTTAENRSKKFSTKTTETAVGNIQNLLEEQVAPAVVNGYRPGEGVEPGVFPTERMCKAVESLAESLSSLQPDATAYTEFAQGRSTYDAYIASLRAQLTRQGGGWVTVAPRDTCQQGNDSESAAISHLSRLNAEVWAAKAGCVGYETGGAQYQAGMIRGFDPAAILTLGLPYNMPAHSLQRSQYVNGLTELTPDIRQALFDSTAEIVKTHYRADNGGSTESIVPWHPYNFHAGNFFDPSSGYSPQDETNAELLKAGCCPMPVWVFSAKFSMEALTDWTRRQIELFEKAGRRLHCVRLKNPGQGRDWTAAAVWRHAKTMIEVFQAKSLDPPIVYVHNHDFNGMGAHIAANVFSLAQAEGFNYMVIDAGYRKNGTHNDNTVMVEALKLTTEQRDALLEYNHNQQQIEKLLCRFDSRNSQMTPWDSDWAGGTEGSDIRIAKEFALDVRKINAAKEVASEVFPLERAVTPFSEYKLRLGIGIMIEDGIKPKTPEAVRAWVNGGGKLKVGGDVLVGLKRWETLVPKTPDVDKLLSNMKEELETALAQKSKLIKPDDLPASFTAAQRYTALGYQSKGLEFVTKRQAMGKDLSALLLAPHVLHREPKMLPSGTKFDLLSNPRDYKQRLSVTFDGFDMTPGGDLTLSFSHSTGSNRVIMSPQSTSEAGSGASGVRKAQQGNAFEFACEVPGELVSYAVKVGDTLVEGEPLCTLESMKMEIVISVPAEVAGRVVKSLPVQPRTKTTQGGKLSPGDLLLELSPGHPAPSPELPPPKRARMSR